MQESTVPESISVNPEIWHCKKQENANGNAVASGVVEAPGFKGSGRETGTWHHVAESEFLKRGRRSNW